MEDWVRQAELGLRLAIVKGLSHIRSDEKGMFSSVSHMPQRDSLDSLHPLMIQ